MHAGDIIAAEWSARPQERPGLFPGRPWVVYYEGATRRDGKRARRGMRSFETEADARRFRADLGHIENDGAHPF